MHYNRAVFERNKVFHIAAITRALCETGHHHKNGCRTHTHTPLSELDARGENASSSIVGWLAGLSVLFMVADVSWRWQRLTGVFFRFRGNTGVFVNFCEAAWISSNSCLPGVSSNLNQTSPLSIHFCFCITLGWFMPPSVTSPNM